MVRLSPIAVSLACAAAAASAAVAEPAFLRTSAELEDPRGYCLDVPGFGASLDLDAPITTHSCKYSRPGFSVDQLLEQTADDRLRLVSYDRCLSATVQDAGAGVDMVACAEGGDAWRIAEDGRVTPDGGDGLCLTVAAEPVFVNTDVMTAPPYSSRAVTLEPCAAEAADRQTWRRLW